MRKGLKSLVFFGAVLVAVPGWGDDPTTAGMPQTDADEKTSAAAVTGGELSQSVCDQYRQTSNFEEIGKLDPRVVNRTAFENCHKAMVLNEQATRAKLCTTELDISNQSLGMFAKAKKSADTFKAITGLAIALRENKSCKLLMAKKHKDSKKRTPEACVITYDSAATNEQINHYNQQSKTCKQLALAMSNDIDQQLLSAHSIHKDFSRTAKLVKWGAIGGAAAVGGGLIYKNKKENKKERRRAEALKQEFQDGIITDTEGKKIDCKTTATYKLMECQESLMAHCSQAENSEKGGCQAFYANYCATAGASTNTCFMRAAKVHCSVPGASVPIDGVTLSESPACKWTAELSKECRANADSLSCYPKFDTAYLTAECPKYMNDPICQRHNAGNLVLQPPNNGVTGSILAQAPTPAPSESSASLSSLIGNSGKITPSLLDSASRGYLSLCKSGELDCSTASK